MTNGNTSLNGRPPGAGRLTPQQTNYLLSGIARGRVQNLRGMAHLEAWDVRRTLIRVFGIEGFTIETLALDLVAEKQTGQGPKPRWTVVYRAQVRLTVKDTSGWPIGFWEDAAAGDAVNQPSLGDAHDLAMKTALSQALKRCAVNLGDQFGLSLYNNGSRDPVVLRSLAYQGEPVPPEEDVPVQPEPTPATPHPITGRDFVAEARQATDAATVRRIWQEAKAAGESEQRLGWIETVGKSLAAGPPPPKPAGAGDRPPTEDIAEADEEEAEAAEKELLAFAEEHDLRDIAADFERAKGLPLSRATAIQIRGFLAELNGSAA